MPIDSIRQILDADERAVAFFTRGAEFHQEPDNTGYTGSWLVSSVKIQDGFFEGITVIIYLQANNQNTIYRSECTGVEGPLRNKTNRSRYRLLLANIEAIDITYRNWFACAETRRQDFAYFNC